MTRALHDRADLVTLSDRALSRELTDRAHGDVLVVASAGDGLETYLATAGNGQTTLTESDSLLPAHWTYHVGDLPTSSDEHLPFEPDSYDTVVGLWGLTGYFQRPPPFLDFTRVARPGGTLLTATGVQPNEPPYHDFKGWVPSTQEATLDDVVLIRWADAQTPNLLASFTITDGRDP